MFISGIVLSSEFQIQPDVHLNDLKLVELNII